MSKIYLGTSTAYSTVCYACFFFIKSKNEVKFARLNFSTRLVCVQASRYPKQFFLAELANYNSWLGHKLNYLVALLSFPFENPLLRVSISVFCVCMYISTSSCLFGHSHKSQFWLRQAGRKAGRPDLADLEGWRKIGVFAIIYLDLS